MAVHITLSYVHTLCGRPVGELADDSYTTDPLVATSPSVDGCPECLVRLDQPMSLFDVLEASDQAYERGYAQGKDSAYVDMRAWQALSHDPACGCRPCETARILVTKLLASITGGVDDDT